MQPSRRRSIQPFFFTKSAAQYTTLPGDPLIAMPVNPNRPAIPNAATAARITQLNQLCDMEKKIYDKAMDMKPRESTDYC